ncbi:extracellular serine-rich protein [Seiridium cupressi]
MFTKTITVAALVAAASAAPTGTTGSDTPSRTVSLTGVTHTVAAGRGALSFEPNNIFAQVGDVVEWHFAPKNHSVAQSSFGEPCKPLTDGSGAEVGFFSGFNFATTEGQSKNIFRITVEDPKPIWFYCSQTVGNHCQNGMAGSINQNPDSDFNLTAFRDKARMSGVSISPAMVQPAGGVQINPNPLSGF